ncbi:hypothetical protein DXG03_006948, partial [Asterophora parasitica]
MSWIWARLGDGSQMVNNEGMKDAPRIEYCKTKARADRWSEEVELLLEEMHRPHSQKQPTTRKHNAPPARGAQKQNTSADSTHAHVVWYLRF